VAPAVSGIAEMFRARFVGHVYPAQTHDVWALVIVAGGVIGCQHEPP
jgi:hypothetical protein